MKQYFLKTAGTLSLLALTTVAAFAQDDVKEEKSKSKDKERREDVIIIRPKVETNTKVTVEVNGDDIKINGKPISEFKDDNVSVTFTKDINGRVATTTHSRFRTAYGGNGYSYSPQTFSFTSDEKKAFLGVGTEKVSDGASVVTLSENSAADKAGLKKGDVITKINETKIESPEDLSKTISKLNPDDKITIVYKRDKKEQKTSATLGKRKMSSVVSLAPDDQYAFKGFNLNNDLYNNNNYNFAWGGKPRLGLKAQETEDGKGLKVLDVDDESVAEKAGIKEDDIITEFDGKEVNNIDTLREISKGALEKNNFKVKLIRDGKSQEVEVKIPKKLKSANL